MKSSIVITLIYVLITLELGIVFNISIKLNRKILEGNSKFKINNIFNIKSSMWYKQ